MALPVHLESDMRALMGDEYGDFLGSLGTPPRQSYRVNTIKADVEEIVERFPSEAVPWCECGFYTDLDLGGSVEHFQGLIYIEDASSMIPPEVLAPTADEVVLDMCAAPGGKSTHLAALMRNQGCIVANEVDYSRLKTLRFNLNRMGVANAVVANMDGARLECGLRFDKILLDAPCSNLGQIRDNPDAIRTFSRAKVKRMSETQKRLIDAAALLLKDGGVLLYSTCTLYPDENEEVVDYALSEHPLKVEPMDVKVKGRPGVTQWKGKEYAPQLKDTLRLYPHDTGSGFYVAKLRRT
jgi:tRNA (cytosine49-C5)-methyltransferase